MMKLLHFTVAACMSGLMLASGSLHAAEPTWRTAYTLFGQPKYASDFTHFDYVNPKAPKGGLIRFSWPQSFDSLNNFILKGVKGPGLGMLYESLMTGALDEPQTYYPLLATRFKLAEDKTWMEFELNPAAKWHDGKAITAEDIAFSLEMLKTKSDPVYRMVYAPLKEVEVLSTHRVKFHFVDGNNREQALLAATLPILPKHYYAEHEFEKTTLTPPLGSGPYRICGVEAARAIRYCRVENHWGKALPVYVGQHNFATIRYDVYRDETVALESFKAGNVDVREEYVARNWANAYESPALAAGRFNKELIPNKIPQGMQAFTFNLRQAKFADRRVREAIALSMDFEWLNKALFYNAYARNRSFFLNTQFEARDLPSTAEAALLEPYRADLPEALWYEPFEPSRTDGDGNNRPNLLRAQTLLNEAGWKLKDGVRVSPVDGSPLEIEFLLAQPTLERVVGRMRAGLQKLGIRSRVRTVDSAQYQHRVDHRDFDIISIWMNRGLNFPGVEQTSFWHSSQAGVEGSNNVAGMQSPLVDALTTRIANAQTLEELEPAGRALDRVLLWEHVVIPHWHSKGWRLAWWNKFGQPEITPEYGLNTSAWWSKDTPEKR